MAQSSKYAKLLEILKFLKTEKTRSNLLILQFQLSLATTTKDSETTINQVVFYIFRRKKTFMHLHYFQTF